MAELENTTEEEIKNLKKALQGFEDTDTLYMNEELKELRHYVTYAHTRLEESLGYLITKSILAPLGSAKIPVDTFQRTFASGTSVVAEIDFSRKADLARNLDQIDDSLYGHLRGVNSARVIFSHPSKYQNKIRELGSNKNECKKVLQLSVDTMKEMDKVFEKFAPNNG